MKDAEIFRMLEQSTGLSAADVADFRPCTERYNDYGIPRIPDAITIQLKQNGTLIYIPDRNTKGSKIKRGSNGENGK